MAKKYTRVNWKSGKEGNTPLTATNLNKMDKGLYDLSVSTAEFQASQIETNEALKSRNLELERSLDEVREFIYGSGGLDDILDAPEEAKEPTE